MFFLTTGGGGWWWWVGGREEKCSRCGWREEKKIEKKERIRILKKEQINNQKSIFK